MAQMHKKSSSWSVGRYSVACDAKSEYGRRCTDWASIESRLRRAGTVNRIADLSVRWLKMLLEEDEKGW